MGAVDLYKRYVGDGDYVLDMGPAGHAQAILRRGVAGGPSTRRLWYRTSPAFSTPVSLRALP